LQASLKIKSQLNSIANLSHNSTVDSAKVSHYVFAQFDREDITHAQLCYLGLQTIAIFIGYLFFRPL
jgi:hypothetical protein